MVVNFRKLDTNAVIPFYAKLGDAGMDLTAVSKTFDEYGNVVYGTGLAFEIPFGYVGFIFPRSSVSKYNLDLANAVGVIDAGYRGELICKFKATSTALITPIESNKTLGQYSVGDKVAQIIIMPRPFIELNEVEELSDSERGDGGFGSTGK